jgi:SP family sugar:H+ symporter-like MFS transporter
MNENRQGNQAKRETDGAVPSPTGAGTPGSTAYVLFLSSAAALGGFLFGFDSGVINGAVNALADAFHTEAVGTGFAVSSALLGCGVGAFLAGTLSDRLGRRPTMLLTAGLFLLSGIVTGAANSAIVFILARISGGLAIGSASVLAPAYISEVAPAHLRGRLASLQQLAIVLGLFISFLSNYLLAWSAGGAGEPFWLGAPAWRWMFWMDVVPSVAYLLAVLLIPESPRFLIASGQLEPARRIFARIGGDADELVRQVQESLRGEHRPRLADLREPTTGRLAPVVWVGIGVAVFQQFVGINVIFYYGEVLWQAAGATESSALRINLLTGLVNILATFLAIALIDKVGRRPLLLAGSLGMVLTLGTMTFVFAMAQVGADGKPIVTRGQAVTGLVAGNLYIAAFAVSWGPVVWVLLGEMFPNRQRGAGLAVAGASNWVANFAVTVTFLPLLKAIGLAGAYALYAAAALASMLFVWTAVRETKGRTLEEMTERGR